MSALSSGGRRGGYQFESLGAELFVRIVRFRAVLVEDEGVRHWLIQRSTYSWMPAGRRRGVWQTTCQRCSGEPWRDRDRSAKAARERYQHVLADLGRDAAIRANVDPATLIGEACVDEKRVVSSSSIPSMNGEAAPLDATKPARSGRPDGDAADRSIVCGGWLQARRLQPGLG